MKFRIREITEKIDEDNVLWVAIGLMIIWVVFGFLMAVADIM